MKFSIYSELQWWPGKSPGQLYDEVLEQIENADRLGYDAYSAIEHFFFPKFSSSPDPIALFSAAAQRTKRINFRTLVHVLPYHNPMVLASRIAFADILMGGRYEFGVGRGHGWIPWRAGVSYAEMVERYDESLEILFTALESGGEPFSYAGKFYDVHDARIVPPLVEHERPPADERTAAGYGFYTAGILEKLAETPYEEMVAGDIVWVGTPEDVIERIETVREVCDGLTEISITVNPGNFDHW